MKLVTWTAHAAYRLIAGASDALMTLVEVLTGVPPYGMRGGDEGAGPGADEDDDEEEEEDSDEARIAEASTLNDRANELFWKSYPKGPGRRAKRCHMRKAVRLYEAAVEALGDMRSHAEVDVTEFRFRLLANLANAHRAMCDRAKLSSTLGRLDDIILFRVDDDDEARAEEYDLRALAIEAHGMLTMYRAGDEASLTETAALLEDIHSSPHFMHMSAQFRSTHWHYAGLLALMRGEAKPAFDALAVSCRLRADAEPSEVNRSALRWSDYLLKKASKRMHRVSLFEPMAPQHAKRAADA
jgi:hypothetical protein